MEKFILKGTVVGGEEFESLEEAKKAGKEGAVYTQEDMVITDEEGNELTRARWYGLSPSEEEIEDGLVLCKFGSNGFYATWSDEME